MSRTRRPPPTEERRNVLRGLATGFAGAVAAPAVASAAGVEPQVEAAADASAPDAHASSRLLDTHEHATLANLSERLVPGSVEAGVPELMDRVGDVDAMGAQRALRDAIRAFEGEARRRHGSRWIALDDETQLGILEEASSAPGTPLHEHLVSLRDRVARAYFATEPGMRRLGWTRRSAFRELPACSHPGDDHR